MTRFGCLQMSLAVLTRSLVSEKHSVASGPAAGLTARTILNTGVKRKTYPLTLVGWRCPISNPSIICLGSLIVILLRFPQHYQSVLCTMRVRLSDLACVAFLCGHDHSHIKRIAALCATRSDLIKLYPLYLLAFVYDLRSERWFHSLSDLVGRVEGIETVTNLTTAARKGSIMA